MTDDRAQKLQVLTDKDWDKLTVLALESIGGTATSDELLDVLQPIASEVNRWKLMSQLYKAFKHGHIEFEVDDQGKVSIGIREELRGG